MAKQATALTIAGWTITIAVTLFMLLDVSFDLRQAPMAVEANAKFGIPADLVLSIGIAGLIGTLLYLLPQTCLIGAILLTGFLGGAVFTHMRVHGSFRDIAENVVIGVLIWGGIWLRDPRLRSLMPIRMRG